MGPQGPAGENTEIFLVRIGGGNVPDHTEDEILAAVDEGKVCIADDGSGLVYTYVGKMPLRDNANVNAATFYSPMMRVGVSVDVWCIQIYGASAKRWWLQDTRIANPFKITFTGAVEAEYDGSNGITVEIPEGGTGGGGSGADGEDGGFYTPSVNANGVLSWTASKADMPSVSSANIKGPIGPQGAPGSDGAPGAPGKDGADGFSPTVTLTREADGVVITATNKDGETSEKVYDGKDGAGGEGGGLPEGGEPHQMLVTDSDGNAKWEERTHYETFVNSDILPENSPMYVPDTGSFMMTEPFVVTPEPGNTYTVVWNGTAFSCSSVMANIDGLNVVYLGNGIVIGGEDTGEPFGIAVFPPDMMEEMGGVTGMILPLDGSTEATVAITGGYLSVKKIDEKYLPSIGASNIINGTQTGSVRSRDASEEIGEYAFAFGENVKASGDHSVAFGSDNEATNENAVALGYGCKAVGAVSTAIGLGLVTNDNMMGQTVLGRYNVAEGNRILIVGCGGSSTPKNVFTVSNDGTGWFRYNIYVGGTKQSEGRKVLTEGDIDSIADAVIAKIPSAEGVGF